MGKLVQIYVILAWLAIFVYVDFISLLFSWNKFCYLLFNTSFLRNP